MAAATKIVLEESEIPTHWYNVVADLPNPSDPPIGPHWWLLQAARSVAPGRRRHPGR